MLPRANRITERREFNRFYSRGKQFRSPLLSVHVLPRAGTEGRFGISVSKRVGGAVERNLVKRRLREACRKVLLKGPPAGDFVLVARPAALQAEFGPLCAAVEMLVRQADQEVSQWMLRQAQGNRTQDIRHNP